MDRFTEKTIDSHRVFEGRLLKVDSVDVELADGRKSVREIVRHPGAVAVLVRGADKRYVFVHQYRKPAEKVMLARDETHIVGERGLLDALTAALDVVEAV